MTKKAKSLTTDLDRCRRLLEELGFELVPQVLPELLERTVREDLSFSNCLEMLLDSERQFREERRIKTSLRLSGLPVGKTLEEYDFAFQRGIPKDKIELLGTCEFARRKENVLLLGPPGVGKSHLAAALGVKAIQNGFSVAFMTTDELIARLRRDEEAGQHRRASRRRYMTVAVLVLDELGFQALDRREAHLLFKLVSYRYERGSTIITSNKGIRDWPETLAGDEVLATAILDRLLHHCHIVSIDGRSFRMRQMEHLVNRADVKGSDEGIQW